MSKSLISATLEKGYLARSQRAFTQGVCISVDRTTKTCVVDVGSYDVNGASVYLQDIPYANPQTPPPIGGTITLHKSNMSPHTYIVVGGQLGGSTNGDASLGIDGIPTSLTVSAVANAGQVGTAQDYSRGDHAHEGVHGLFLDGEVLDDATNTGDQRLHCADGTIGLVRDGTNPRQVNISAVAPVGIDLHKFTIGFAAVAAVGGVLTGTLPIGGAGFYAAGTVVLGVKLKHSTQFNSTGGLVTSLKFNVDDALGMAMMNADLDGLSAVSNTNMIVHNRGGVLNHGAGDSLLLKCTAIGAFLSTLNAGSIDVWVWSQDAT